MIGVGVVAFFFILTTACEGPLLSCCKEQSAFDLNKMLR